MDPFEILLTYDLNMIRDNKIDYLISNKDILKKKKLGLYPNFFFNYVSIFYF
jgi:hypothetical protein